MIGQSSIKRKKLMAFMAVVLLVHGLASAEVHDDTIYPEIAQELDSVLVSQGLETKLRIIHYDEPGKVPPFTAYVIDIHKEFSWKDERVIEEITIAALAVAEISAHVPWEALMMALRYDNVNIWLELEECREMAQMPEPFDEECYIKEHLCIPQ